MHSFSLSAGSGRYQVEAVVVVCGRDLAIHIGGGESPHIGAAALAIPRPSLIDKAALSASASVLCVVGHKEDEIARTAALRMAASVNACVTVTVGLHIDDASAIDITTLQSNFDKLIGEIEIILIKDSCMKSS
jgi:hypothetical protein